MGRNGGSSGRGGSNGSPSGATEFVYRFQPVGKSLHGHTSGLGAEKVAGIFAFTDPSKVYDTVTYLHMKRQGLEKYELVKFRAHVVDRPEDSEGVVVRPSRGEGSRTPMHVWHAANKPT
jgi:hypothetical protein